MFHFFDCKRFSNPMNYERFAKILGKYYVLKNCFISLKTFNF